MNLPILAIHETTRIRHSPFQWESSVLGETRACACFLPVRKAAAVPILEERIAAAGLEGRIRFVGIRKDIERLMLGERCLAFSVTRRGARHGRCRGASRRTARACFRPTVPRECVVVPELVRFKKVEAGEAAWADDLLQLAAQPRNIPDANQRVAASAFSIEKSSRALLQLYSEGTLA